MRGALWLVAGTVGLSLVLLLPAPALTVRFATDRPAAGALPWLSVSQGRIVDSEGRTVILRGFNDDALLQTGTAPLPPPLSAADASLMESHGFDLVRIPVSWSLLEPTPGHFSQGYLRQVEAMVDLCARHGLYSVIDLHTQDFGVAFGGSGAPTWLTLPLVPDWHFPGIPAPWQRHLSPAVNANLAFFWLYPNWQRLYWQAWRQLASAFAANSAVAGYDLYNEPHPLPVPPGIFSTRILFPFYADGIRQISAVDPNHLFIVEGDLFGDLPTRVVPLRAPNLVYSTHLYQGSLIGPSYAGQVSPLRAELQQGLSGASQLPAAYWTGELGIDHNQGDAVAWAATEIALSDQYLTGWAWWQWYDSTGWGVRQGPAKVDSAWLSVLSQPYVQAAPGTLAAMRYDPARHLLSAEFRGASPGTVAQVAWPQDLGRPRVTGGCARLRAASPGRVQITLLAPSCNLTVAPLQG